MPIKVNGATSGSVTLAAPDTGSDVSLTLPTTAIATESYADSAASIGGGLVLIDEESFSAVSSVSLNNVFSATYENYLIKANFTTSASNEVAMRLRASGTDATTNYRGTYLRVPEGTGGPTSANHATDRLEPGYADIGAKSAIEIQLFGPNSADDTMAVSVGANYANDTRYTQAFQTDSTAFDGFTLYTAAGALLTGSIRVYGYKGA